MRKDNYLIGMINRGVINLRPPPGATRRGGSLTLMLGEGVGAHGGGGHKGIGVQGYRGTRV